MFRSLTTFLKTEPVDAQKMGIMVSDTDSELLNEKGQTITAHKQSYCPFVLLRQALSNHREKREQQYRPRIDEIRERINEDREEAKLSGKTPWQNTTSTEQRRSIWERGLGESSLRHHGYTFSTSHRYKIILSDCKTGKKTIVIHDFSTPEGRDEAFTWWETKHQQCKGSRDAFLRYYERWENLFQIYIKEHHNHQRKVLLLEPIEIKWVDTEVEQLPN